MKEKPHKTIHKMHITNTHRHYTSYCECARAIHVNVSPTHTTYKTNNRSKTTV